MKWISINEKRPEKSGAYLTFLENGEMEVFSYSKRHNAFNADDDDDGCLYAIDGVTHWMPLPEKPEV